LRESVGVEIKVVIIVFLEAFPIHLFRHFCCRMYHLATIHFVTDNQTRRTDRQHNIMMTIPDHNAWQYGRLKSRNTNIHR